MKYTDLEYYKQLVNIRTLMEDRLPNFPYLKCQHSTRLVNKIIGLEELAGEYSPAKDWHAWNYDPGKKLYVDLTQDQYFGCDEPICILPEQTNILITIPLRIETQKKYRYIGQDQSIEKLIDLYHKKFS